METRHDDILTLPDELEPGRLWRRALQILILVGVLTLVVLLAPGLGHVRELLGQARPGWIAVAIALEALSCLSYIVMFRPIFCRRMSWRTTWEIGWSELGVGSLVPASGVGGLALGAWVLTQGGMPGDKVARRSVAFFLIKSSVNFVAVAVIGTLMFVGVIGPHRSPWLTIVPAALAALVIAAVPLLRMIGPRIDSDASGFRRLITKARRAVADGTGEAIAILRSGNVLVIAGAIGYWAFDNAVLWATFHAFGSTPPLAVLLMGYLIGQMGGLLPIPGGIGGIDGGLIGTFIVYGTPAATTTAAVLAYRVILFWLPLIVGAIAFISLRRALNSPERPDLCPA